MPELRNGDPHLQDKVRFRRRAWPVHVRVSGLQEGQGRVQARGPAPQGHREDQHNQVEPEAHKDQGPPDLRRDQVLLQAGGEVRREGQGGRPVLHQHLPVGVHRHLHRRALQAQLCRVPVRVLGRSDLPHSLINPLASNLLIT